MKKQNNLTATEQAILDRIHRKDEMFKAEMRKIEALPRYAKCQSKSCQRAGYFRCDK